VLVVRTQHVHRQVDGKPNRILTLLLAAGLDRQSPSTFSPGQRPQEVVLQQQNLRIFAANDRLDSRWAKLAPHRTIDDVVRLENHVTGVELDDGRFWQHPSELAFDALGEGAARDRKSVV